MTLALPNIDERADYTAQCAAAWVIGLLRQQGAPFALQTLTELQTGAAHVTVACELSAAGATLACQLVRGTEVTPLGAAVVRLPPDPATLN